MDIGFTESLGYVRQLCRLSRASDHCPLDTYSTIALLNIAIPAVLAMDQELATSLRVVTRTHWLATCRLAIFEAASSMVATA